MRGLAGYPNFSCCDALGFVAGYRRRSYCTVHYSACQNPRLCYETASQGCCHVAGPRFLLIFHIMIASASLLRAWNNEMANPQGQPAGAAGDLSLQPRPGTVSKSKPMQRRRCTARRSRLCKMRPEPEHFCGSCIKQLMIAHGQVSQLTLRLREARCTSFRFGMSGWICLFLTSSAASCFLQVERARFKGKQKPQQSLLCTERVLSLCAQIRPAPVVE